jgi:hypothetical protein
VLLRHAGTVRDLAFAADGRTLVSVGQDGRLFVTLAVDQRRWQRREGPAPVPQPARKSEPRGVRSPDGRWIAWPGTSAPAPSPFSVDFSGLASLDLPRLTVLDASNHQVLVDGGELPGDLGDAIVAGPVFAADSSRVAVQVRERLQLGDLSTSAPLDAVVALPPGARLLGAALSGAGWIAGTDAAATAHFFFDTDVDRWARVSCSLAGRALSAEEWRRYVGNEQPYAPACSAGGQAKPGR